MTTKHGKLTWDNVWAQEQAEEITKHHDECKKAEASKVENGIKAGQIANVVFSRMRRGEYKKYREAHLTEVGERMDRYYRRAATGCDHFKLEPAMVAASGFGLVEFGNWAAGKIKQKITTVTEGDMTAAAAEPLKSRENSAPTTKLDRAKNAIEALSDKDRTKLWNWVEEKYQARVTDISAELEDGKVM